MENRFVRKLAEFSHRVRGKIHLGPFERQKPMSGAEYLALQQYHWEQERRKNQWKWLTDLYTPLILAQFEPRYTDWTKSERIPSIFDMWESGYVRGVVNRDLDPEPSGDSIHFPLYDGSREVSEEPDKGVP